jgi:hypothetical protein
VFGERFAEGVSVALFPLTFTVPVTATPPAVVASLMLAVFSVESCIASEKVTDIGEFSPTPVAAFDGEVSETVGGVVSGVETIGGVLGTADPAVGPSADECPHPARLRLPSSAAVSANTEYDFDLTVLSFNITEPQK